LKSFSALLLCWYHLHKRDLPWRKTRDPFKIWLSEIIFQQTRISQGLQYYLRFTERFDNVESLSEASEEEILRLWQGLGYYTRARNLHAAASQIMKEWKGVFPEDYHEMLRIKGIGEYTAAAVASIAFGQAYPVVDGNVYRVMSRYLLIDEPVNSAGGKKKILTYLNENIDRKEPGTFNQALMEVGALVCTPQNPSCPQCPVMKNCRANKEGLTRHYPTRIKKNKPLDRYFHYIILVYKDGPKWGTVIQQRKAGDIWAGLYEFPLIESDHPLDASGLLHHEFLLNIIKNPEYRSWHLTSTFHHKLTHRNINAVFLIITLNKSSLYINYDYFKYVYLNHLFNYPFPRLIEKFISKDLSSIDLDK
jgi:A/G-specific adenine glycosylase